jgi:hypothetical protein
MKALLKKLVPKSLANLVREKLHGRYYVLQQETDGLIAPAVYERLHDEVAKLPDMDIIEVGGAGGTASIAMAWALKEGKKKSHLIVIEKCEGGTRTQYGGKQENLNRIQRNLQQFGAAPFCKIFPEYLTFENGDQVLQMIGTPQIAGLVIDADGLLHRDFHFFWPRLMDGGLIVVDDYEENRDAKHHLTFVLLNQLIEWGLFEKVENVQGVMFGRKPKGGDISKLDRAVCEQIVAQVGEKFRVAFNQPGVVQP